MKTKLGKSAWTRRLIGILAAVLLLAASAHLAAGQKNKKLEN